jgi:hypothetical protein
MTIQIDLNDIHSPNARRDVETQLEFDPPPDFKKVAAAVDWAETNLPMNVYFEVWGKNDRIWYQGWTKVGSVKRGGKKRCRT